MVARALVADAEVIGMQESGPDWRCQEPWVDGQHRTAPSSARDEKGPPFWPFLYLIELDVAHGNWDDTPQLESNTMHTKLWGNPWGGDCEDDCVGSGMVYKKRALSNLKIVVT